MAIIPALVPPFRMQYNMDGLGGNITLKVVSGEGQQSSGAYDLKAFRKQLPETEAQITFGDVIKLGKDTDLDNYRLSVLVQVVAKNGLNTAVTVEVDGGVTPFSQTFTAQAPAIGDVMSYEIYFRLMKKA